jgi:hypothetical protein
MPPDNKCYNKIFISRNTFFLTSQFYINKNSETPNVITIKKQSTLKLAIRGIICMCIIAIIILLLLELPFNLKLPVFFHAL